MNKSNNNPKTTHACFTLLKRWSKQQSTDSGIPNRMGVAFTNVGNEDSGDEEGIALSTKGTGYQGSPCQKMGLCYTSRVEGNPMMRLVLVT